MSNPVVSVSPPPPPPPPQSQVNSSTSGSQGSRHSTDLQTSQLSQNVFSGSNSSETNSNGSGSAETSGGNESSVKTPPAKSLKVTKAPLAQRAMAKAKAIGHNMITPWAFRGVEVEDSDQTVWGVGDRFQYVTGLDQSSLAKSQRAALGELGLDTTKGNAFVKGIKMGMNMLDKAGAPVGRVVARFTPGRAIGLDTAVGAVARVVTGLTIVAVGLALSPLALAAGLLYVIGKLAVKAGQLTVKGGKALVQYIKAHPRVQMALKALLGAAVLAAIIAAPWLAIPAIAAAIGSTVGASVIAVAANIITLLVISQAVQAAMIMKVLKNQKQPIENISQFNSQSGSDLYMPVDRDPKTDYSSWKPTSATDPLLSPSDSEELQDT